MARFVEDVSHHLREFDDGAFGRFRVDVDQGVDVVERVHEEVRIDLILQIIHFGLEILAFEGLHLLFVAHGLVDELDAGVCTGHEESEDDVPVDLQVGERSLSVGFRDIDAGLFDEVVGQVFFVDLHQPEDADDQDQIAQQILSVLVTEHVSRGEERIVDDEDDQIGSDLPPGDEDVFQIDVHFGHHLGVEHRHQDDGRPDHHVEQIFANGLLAGEFHDPKIRKKPGFQKPGLVTDADLCAIC